MCAIIQWPVYGAHVIPCLLWFNTFTPELVCMQCILLSFVYNDAVRSCFYSLLKYPLNFNIHLYFRCFYCFYLKQFNIFRNNAVYVSLIERIEVAKKKLHHFYMLIFIKLFTTLLPKFNAIGADVGAKPNPRIWISI